MTHNIKYPWKSNKGRATGKAHAVVSALSDEDADDYRRSSGQSYEEFQREREIIFDRWVRSLKEDLMCESLRELVLMGEIKKATPPDLWT